MTEINRGVAGLSSTQGLPSLNQNSSTNGWMTHDSNNIYICDILFAKDNNVQK